MYHQRLHYELSACVFLFFALTITLFVIKHWIAAFLWFSFLFLFWNTLHVIMDTVSLIVRLGTIHSPAQRITQCQYGMKQIYNDQHIQAETRCITPMELVSTDQLFSSPALIAQTYPRSFLDYFPSIHWKKVRLLIAEWLDCFMIIQRLGYMEPYNLIQKQNRPGTYEMIKNKAMDAFQNGESVMFYMYPCERIDIGPFDLIASPIRTGMIQIAIDAGVPIVPIVMENLRLEHTQGRVPLRRLILEPIHVRPDDDKHEIADQIRCQVNDAMLYFESKWKAAHLPTYQSLSSKS